MSPHFVIALEGLAALKFVEEFDPKIERSVIRALNKTAVRARTAAASAIRREIAFPARYLAPSEGRLTVGKKAGPNSLEASIRGRNRPTSLARFAVKGTPPPGQRSADGEIAVTVKPGVGRKIPRAFLINLKGAPESNNIGLAVRTDGGPPVGAYRPRELTRLGKNLWLLYGPSVGQALRGVRSTRGGVVSEIAPDTLDFLNREFLRLMALEK